MKKQPPISLYWKCQIIGWSMAALYWGYLGYMGTGFSWLLALLHFITDVLICISITHPFRSISKKYNWQELRFQKLLLRILPSMLLLAFVYMVLSIIKLYLVHSNFREDFSQSFLQFYHENNVGIFVGGTRLMSIWLLAYYLYHYAQREIKIIQENARLNLIAKEAQLNNLSAQLNPHFLFNSLNSIKSLVVESPNESRRAIDLLSDLLRKSLYERGPVLTSIKDELAVVSDYLELEKIRFEERLQFTIDVPDQLLSFSIIPFSIQTLVENAVKHGINKQSEGGNICIKVGYENTYIRMTVESPGYLNKESVSRGLGLKNLQERLSLQFHNKASFSISQQNSETVLATIMTPAA
ncbi:MAG: histidine kinase [Flavisolibacter sp.]|nr:histidine kinase [Flavisolibacter sp.]MBD0284485.1 histidine kinase [Flavisolibacter sp.]MBD0350620.1 histidine kinase [Flavisolibacter sp.]